MIFVYKQDENIFKKINLNTKVNQSALNMPVIKYENLHEIIQKEIKSSNLREQEIVVLNKTNYITEKITTLINNLKNLSMYEDNTSIYKSIYDTIHNNPSNSIEIYDYSTDASNINICFSVTGVYQISLIIRNNRISIVFWNLLNGTINALRFSQENKKFIKTSFKEMHILNTFPPKNSLIALINNVMKKNQIHQLYIDTYTSVIDDILEFIKILKNKKSTPESIQKFKRTMNEKKIAFQMNSDNNTNNISMSFVIKNVFEIKFIINNHRNIFKISLIKIPPRNTYIYDITTTNFIKENEENNLLETPKILRIM